MMLQECYAKLGGDYQDVMKRLRDESLVRKFVVKFLEDKSCTLFHSAVSGDDWDAAFRAVHTLKGVCQNLGFTKLGESSAAVCEHIRWKRYDEAVGLAAGMYDDYDAVVAAIREFVKDGE